MASHNPLLSMAHEVPFDRIRAEHVLPAVDALIAETQERMAAIVAVKGTRTFENTLRAFDTMTESLDATMAVTSHLESVATSPELRDAYNAAEPKVSEVMSGIYLSDPLYAALRDYANTDEAKALVGPKKRYLDKTLAEFRRAGAGLDASGKKRLSAIDVALSTATLTYSQNVLDATNAFEMLVTEEAQLAGLPESAVLAARESAKAKGKEGWRFTLQPPSYVAVMTHMDDRALRERMYRAWMTRGSVAPHDNRRLLGEILGLRAEKAKLLGYAHFADLVLEDRMAKSGARARAFVASLREKTLPHFARENAELQAFRAKLEGPNAPALEPWDVGYYAEKLRVSLYDFDDEALRPYFALENVLAGLFAIGTKLYGIRIERVESAPTWHPSVRVYRVADESGAWIGSFYVDVFPREEKRDGAWMHGLVTGTRPGEKHLGVLAANVTPPVGDRPALLTHREVETLFHEFGHLMHHALSRVAIRGMAGTNVAWDFVELPSQIMENWCWERESLDLFARHVDTGAPIPDDVLERMKRARSFRSANAMMRQLGFASVDLALHVDYDPSKDGDVVEYARASIAPFMSVAPPPGYAMICAFSHLFGGAVGYAAGYYSYKWAEVLDADAFSRFKREGVLNADVGKAFRSSILAMGDSDDPLALYRTFMGREATTDALFQRAGLTT
ncbi:MAG: M3 family metallopeptidase [Polyangiaceae bacterium]